nr:RNA-directed DNA polymerase, eukaryota, reverse transcriptase zinc-binding domain protein [Tanacetum cinerariifolium]
MQQKKYVKDPMEIHNIKQNDGETIEDFMERFKVETGRIKGPPECMRISGFMHGTMEEIMITTTAFIRGEAVAASKKKGHASWKAQDQSKRQNSDKRSKEDDLFRISTSIYVTNFPESYSAKELFQVCKQYGHVVDSFIPAKKSKDGKRFGFVRFINVFNVDRSVGNLCTIWVNRLKLHANLARFQRDPLSTKKVPEKKTVEVNRGAFLKSSGMRKEGNSFASVIKGVTRLEEKVKKLPPSIVLEDDCLLTKDFSKSLMGRVKVFAYLVNLRMALSNEGFADIKIKYMGEFWVLLEFQNKELIQKFRENVSVGSWFSCIKDASMEFQPDKRIVWVEVEGIPLKLWSGNTFNRIAAKWGDLLDVDDQEDSCFHSKRLCVHTKEFNDDVEEELDDDINSNDDGPLEEVIEFVWGKTDDEGDQVNLANEDVKGDNILEEGELNEKEDKSEDPFNRYPILNKLADTGGYDIKSEEVREQKDEGNSANIRSKDSTSESVCSGKFKSSEVPRNGGSILCVMEEIVKVGTIMGYNMEGCTKNITEIIESQGEAMYGVVLCEIVLGYAFDFVHSDSVGNSGGILCAWDPYSFHKSSHTVLDYFVIIRGVWLKIGMETLLFVVYAPHDVRDKRTLWDYLVNVCNQWNGEVVMMGDFNEVRIKSDRSATKMSKLDRFFTSKNLLNRCPNISAITLDRYLSDHRPILLQESMFDYGPVSFKFFHQWLEVEGSNKFVIDSWIVSPRDKFNGMRNLMLKLRFLKAKIREWNHEIRINSKAEFHRLKKELQVMDAELDNGKGSAEVVNKRMEVVNSLHRINKTHASELAQKAKIKWGIMVDGTWIEKPDQVKGEFIKHFRNRFDKPLDNRITIDMCFPKSLTTQQQEELESNVSKEELKRAVWDCGVDKSPGPDGFSFGFYRHFWSTIENDVLEAVNHFLTHGDIPKGCNSSFIVLIPKVLNANMVKDFRPISLIGSIYKIIAKILANRLVNMLDDIVNEVQSAFIAERHILDGPFIINERVVEAGIFKGIELSSSLNISHLFFADDAMFVGRWCDGNIDTLMNVLECFHRASGLRINMSKSKIMGVHVEDSNVKHAASKLGCLILNTPFSYLGTKIGGVMSRVEAWKEVVDKVTSRLSKWKMKSLSIGGRLTLLKSVLGSIPIYHMSIYRVPKRVLLVLESIRSHFFNGHDSNSKKASWVKWSSVITSKEKGGLGVASLYALNRALMLKWKMGDGANTCFWEDNSAEGGILKNKFPRVYALEKNKKVLVSVKMKDPGLDHSLRRKVRGGAEQSQLNALSELLDKANLVPQTDRHIWSLDSSEVFSVASMRKLLDDHRTSLVSSTTRWQDSAVVGCRLQGSEFIRGMVELVVVIVSCI